MKPYMGWDINGKRLKVRQKPDGFLSLHAYACSKPCQCEGFEVYIREWQRHSNGPIWPVLSAKSFKEARETAKQLREMLRSFVPLLELLPSNETRSSN